MCRRLLHLLLLTVASVAPLAADAHAAPRPGVSIVTMTADTTSTLAELDEAKALGARVVRTELAWDAIEPVRSGDRDPEVLAQLDIGMRAAQARGLKVVLLLQRTPCWTSTAPASLLAGCASGAANYPPADYAAYARLATFVTARYRATLAGLEVWNEPDQANELYWAGPDKVVRYAALLKATYPAVKRAAPSVPVLAGAFVGTDGRWLRALYKAGIKGFYDGISVHFYDLPLLGLRTTRAVQRENGDRKPLWLLETGWNSCRPAVRGPQGQPCVTRAIQAKNLRDLVAQTRRTSYLKAVAVYKLRDDTAESFGVLTGDGLRKPAFVALRGAFRRPPRVPALTARIGAARGAVRVTGSGPDGDAYHLEVRVGGKVRYLADFRVDARDRFAITLPAQLGTTGLRVRVSSLWNTRAVVTRRR